MKSYTFEEGMRLLEAGKYYEANSHFGALVEQNSQNHKYWNAFGVSLMRWGYRYDQAR
jgi:Flp pilus assembly protein TadD